MTNRLAVGFAVGLAALGNSEPVRPDLLCGARHGVDIAGTVAVLGCPGWEAVFVFRYTGPSAGPWAWAQTAVLRASDYRDFTWLAHKYVFHADFGRTVAIDGTTLLIGAPRALYGVYPNITDYTLVRIGVDGCEGVLPGVNGVSWRVVCAAWRVVCAAWLVVPCGALIPAVLLSAVTAGFRGGPLHCEHGQGCSVPV